MEKVQKIHLNDSKRSKNSPFTFNFIIFNKIIPASGALTSHHFIKSIRSSISIIHCISRVFHNKENPCNDVETSHFHSSRYAAYSIITIPHQLFFLSAFFFRFLFCGFFFNGRNGAQSLMISCLCVFVSEL